MRHALLFLAALAVPALAQAPQDADVVLAPGHPDLMTDAVTLANDVTSTRITAPTMRELGTLTTTFGEGSDGSVAAIYAVESAQDEGGFETMVAFDWPSLAPISRERRTESLVSVTAYDGASVSGEWGQGDWDPIAYDIDLPRAVFAPETVPLVARALPFRAGYNATVPTFSAEDRLRDYTLTVIGEEPFTRLDGTEMTAWIVERTSSARGDTPRRYAIDGATRELIATVRQAQGDAQIISEPVTAESLAALEADAAVPMIDLRPGLDRLDTSALAAYSQDWIVKLVQPQQQDIGTSTRSVTIDEAAGTLTYVATTNIAMAGQETTERSVSTYPGLAPVSTSIDAGAVVVELAYEGCDGAGDCRVTGTRTVNGETTDVDFALDASIFEPSFASEAVRFVPLEEGFRGAFHTVDPSEGAVAVQYIVRGREEVEGVQAWVVDVVVGEQPPQAFAIDAETREIRRIRLEPQSGVVIDIVPAAE